MSGSDIVLLVVLCVAFAVAVGIIVYNKVKGRSCCGDCNCCSSCGKENKESDKACDGHCPHCSACSANTKTLDKTVDKQ